MRGGDVEDEKESSEDVDAHFLRFFSRGMLFKPGRQRNARETRSVCMLKSTKRNGSSLS